MISVNERMGIMKELLDTKDHLQKLQDRLLYPVAEYTSGSGIRYASPGNQRDKARVFDKILVVNNAMQIYS